MTWERENIIWASGLFEGEGCFKLHTSAGYKSAYATVHITDHDTAVRYAAVFGLKVNGPYDRGPGLKPVWSVDTGRFETVQAMVAAMWPWLGERRRGRAVEVLRGQNTRFGLGGDVCPNGHQRIPENVIPNSRGNCRPCKLESRRAWRHKRRELGLKVA